MRNDNGKKKQSIPFYYNEKKHSSLISLRNQFAAAKKNSRAVSIRTKIKFSLKIANPSKHLSPRRSQLKLSLNLAQYFSKLISRSKASEKVNTHRNRKGFAHFITN
jgi:hypothetical protein